MTRRWPLRLAVSEGLANARSGRRLATLVTAAVALAATGAGLADALDVSALVRAEQSWIDAGAYVLVVEPGQQGSTLDGDRCDALSGVDGVVAAFATSTTGLTAEPANAPGTHATLTEVSPGAYDFFGVPTPTTAAVLVPVEVADGTGVVDGERTALRVAALGGTAPASVATTVVLVDDAALSEQLSSTYLLPQASVPEADACWVRTDAAHVDGVTTYLSTALTTSDGSSAVVRPRLSATDWGVDVVEAFSDRVLRWAWVAAGAVLAALWAVLQRSRRSRWAVYATFGAGPRTLLVVQLTEWVALSGTGALWGWGTATAFAVALGAAPDVTWVQVTAQVTGTWCAATLGAVLVGLLPVGSLLDALKDRS